VPLCLVPFPVESAIRSILGEDFTVLSCRQLKSRRNAVFHITGLSEGQNVEVAAKLFHQPGLAHESWVLRQARACGLSVPRVIGTTSQVLLTEYIPGGNLCDLITNDPKPLYGQLLGQWLAQFHAAFSHPLPPSSFRSTGDKEVEDTLGWALIKGDPRPRNFLYDELHSCLVGVDFEESHIGPVLEDLAGHLAAILDIDPPLTSPKLHLCRVLIDAYIANRGLSLPNLPSTLKPHILAHLKATASRRGNPPALTAQIRRLAENKISL